MLHGQVADPLQVVVDLEHGDDEAQVDGHRLVQGQDLEALLLDLHLGLVDPVVGLDHVLRQPGRRAAGSTRRP